MLHDAPYWLEWWTANPDVGIESCRQLAADTDPASVGFRDYTELPWFVTPRETGTIQMTGPYVDYVCTDQHTLTVTQPVVVGSTFMGVVGVDLLAATVERLLGADLDATEGVHVVVNRVGRVVASTDLEHVVGDLVHGLPDTAWFTGRRRTGDGDGSAWRFVTCGDLPLAVLTATPTAPPPDLAPSGAECGSGRQGTHFRTHRGWLERVGCSGGCPGSRSSTQLGGVGVADPAEQRLRGGRQHGRGCRGRHRDRERAGVAVHVGEATGDGRPHGVPDAGRAGEQGHRGTDPGGRGGALAEHEDADHVRRDDEPEHEHHDEQAGDRVGHQQRQRQQREARARRREPLTRSRTGPEARPPRAPR